MWNQSYHASNSVPIIRTVIILCMNKCILTNNKGKIQLHAFSRTVIHSTDTNYGFLIVGYVLKVDFCRIYYKLF